MKVILLWLVTLCCFGQGNPPDSLFTDLAPIHAYNLKYRDSPLIKGLPKMLGSSRKCPTCVKLKRTSKVYFALLWTDTLRTTPYYNEAGKLVAPDANKITASFYCSRGDCWIEEKIGTKKVITYQPNVPAESN